MKIKKMFAMMSVSAIPVMASAGMATDIQLSGQTTSTDLDKTATAVGAAGIFTLSAGPIPVTERTRAGERKLMVLEDDYARKLGWIPQAHSAGPQAEDKVAQSMSKTITDIDTGGGGRYDTDRGF